MRGKAVSERLAQAFEFALSAHGEQVRKGTTIPYISHPLAVAAIVMEHGGTEDQVAAAFLHDVIEDCRVPISEIEALFGPAVAGIVSDCTDGVRDSAGRKEGWWKRKGCYVSHLGTTAKPESLLVSAADKLHNARCILSDFRTIGPSLWSRFKTGEVGVAWYYTALAAVFRARSASLPPGLLSEIDSALSEIRKVLTD